MFAGTASSRNLSIESLMRSVVTASKPHKRILRREELERICPRGIEICYPAVCPCRTAQKYCGADAEHKARVGESAGIYRASDFFEKFHIRTLFGSFYINCSVIYRYILVKRHFDIKNCPTVQLLCHAVGHYNFVICRRARRFQHQRLWSNPRQGRRREFFSRRGSQGCSAGICEAVLRRKRDRIRGR